MAEFLLELLSEEIPARMQRRAADDLKRLVTDGLKKARLEYSDAAAYATPRRLVLVIDGLPERQPDLREERKGPKVGAPDKAIAGFKGSLPEGAKIEERESEKGTFFYAVVDKIGRPTYSIVTEIVSATLGVFSWPKSMRWGHSIFTWVRPLEGILAVFDGEPLIASLGLGVRNASEKGIKVESWPPIDFTASTVGHRFLAPGPVTVSSFDDYRDKLLAAFVMFDPVERRSVIEMELAKLASGEGLTVRDDPALLDEVAGLVEWPVVLLGDIDAAFMDLPPEALTSSMRAHQKYFTLLNADGGLAPRFGFVANMVAADGGAAIVAGNERVLRARLADAKFFWDQDRRMPLSDRSPALESIVFHAKLGSVAEKVQRIAALAADLTENIPGADRGAARGAALLCKADLVTGMVGEFPDLQGVMGRYYALADGENPAVAEAIAEHYSPLGPNDRCPTAPVSVALALADKIDTLVGFWLINEKPTGSRDPYALRRAALGVIRLILENGLRVNLLNAFAVAMRFYKDENLSLRDAAGSADAARETAKDLLAFFADRLKVHLREKGVRHDLIAAIFALGDEGDLVRLMARVDALGAFLAAEDGENLLTAYRRAANIVRIESKKDKAAFAPEDYAPDRAEGDEAALWAGLEETRAAVDPLIKAEDFAAAMAALARLRSPVDRFFDTVIVNAEESELRRNRLCLLANLTGVMRRIADFSQIEG